MKTLYTMLIAATVLAGCTNRTSTANATTTTMIAKDTLTYLAIGDSYTVGESVSPEESFPYQLTKSLVADSVYFSTPTIIARTGWTTDDLIKAIQESDINNKTYDMVTLLVGVNDQYQGLTQSNYRVEFKNILDMAIKFAKGNKSHVFILSIPDWGVTPYANGQDKTIAPQIDQFNAINREISKDAGVSYLDVTPISRQAKADTSLIAIDRLHPSGKMYAIWVEQLKQMVKAKFKK